ncbi:hypothetical protein BH11PSE11_BH11PSE11_28840 [soil metagenome]
MGKGRIRLAQAASGNWWRVYLGGLLLLSLGMAAVLLAAQIENGAAGFFLGLVLLAAVIGGCGFLFGLEVMPAALLALLGAMFLGAGLRTVMPRPAASFEFNQHRLLANYAGTHTVQGGKYSRTITHRLVPLVAADWQRGAVIDTWVFDPGKTRVDGGPIRALRLSLDQRESALAAWESALAAHALPRPAIEPRFVELMPDPQAEDGRRIGMLLAGVFAIISLWLLGKPLAWACGKFSAWRK